jgi:hypothetical protein
MQLHKIAYINIRTGLYTISSMLEARRHAEAKRKRDGLELATGFQVRLRSGSNRVTRGI